jgi:K+-sensing histidine kinase KdpD
MGEFISIQRRIISKGDKETTLHEFLEELSRPMEISVGNHCSQRVIVSESDAFTLSLALHVFIDNAKKYAGGLPEISIQPNGNIRVRDYGPGLSIDEIKKMGREIMRKESSFQGQGMGVYFAIGLLKKSGWTVEIRNASPGLQIDLIKRERKD